MAPGTCPKYSGNLLSLADGSTSARFGSYIKLLSTLSLSIQDPFLRSSLGFQQSIMPYAAPATSISTMSTNATVISSAVVPITYPSIQRPPWLQSTVPMPTSGNLPGTPHSSATASSTPEINTSTRVRSGSWPTPSRFNQCKRCSHP
jgi:hypothetical protein